MALASCLLLTTGCKPEKSGQGEQSAADTTQVADTVVATDSVAQQLTPDGQKVEKFTGVVIDGAHESIALRDANGQEKIFEYAPDMDFRNRDSYLVGDTMVVTYVPKGEMGDSVLTVRQTNPEKSRLNAMK